MKKNLRYNVVWLGLAVAVYLLIMLFQQIGVINPVIQDLLITIGINVILASGLNLIIGFSGQFSLGHAGFMAIGAYATGMVANKLPGLLGFFLSILVGMVIAGAVAGMVGVPTLRLKGDYLAIATLGIAEIIRIVIVNGNDQSDGGLFATGGAAGIFGIEAFANWQMVFVFMVITTVVIANYIHSGPGRATLAIREDEIAAESMGVNTTKYKVTAFIIGAMTASVAGSLHASYVGMIIPKDFAFMKSVDILIIVVFGGIGSLTGTFVAAILLGVLNYFLRDIGELRMIIYSLLLIIIMIFKPGGLLGTWEFSVKKLLNKKGTGGDDHVTTGSK
ncbi:branched-chain amino acid ABC transporter permease [Vagococcus sp. BWB3-3]|uniref:Branched-chain amino acid ABC transporter permease n=1 Tax=Vagococcus allomyrinae TaxID=2794353 RepID=A0A940PGG1_9ENTE|nr:branched-chain amino acid ABC transporter permease [Vagococcus allomyrinae]MBP1044162.1 branched-chain amino acid ABC transporter permease [Vagococcus allomyrinae]